MRPRSSNWTVHRAALLQHVQGDARLCKVLLVMIGGLLLLLLLKEVKYGHNIEINIENDNAPKVYAPIAVSPIAVSNSSPIKVSPDVDASPIEVEINRTKILEHEDFVPTLDSFKYYSINRFRPHARTH